MTTGTDSIEPAMLSVAIVLYRPDLRLLESTIRSLGRAIEAAGLRESASLTLIDHSPDAACGSHGELEARAAGWCGTAVTVFSDPANRGFGAGHNRMLGTLGRYHLVLNPDVELDAGALREAIAFMEARPGFGLITPAAQDRDGHRLYLCKRYPSVLDLLLRGLAPQALRKRFAARLARYEMRDLIGDAVVPDPPLVSGCFMFFRSDVFRQVGGFDPRFFLYFEDFDLSLRVASIARLAYVPSVRIVHHGGEAAKKGLLHIWLFGRSAVSFFSKHHWAWL